MIYKRICLRCLHESSINDTFVKQVFTCKGTCNIPALTENSEACYCPTHYKQRVLTGDINDNIHHRLKCSELNLETKLQLLFKITV